MSPLPAASRRFIAYSGEVCRNSGASRPGICALHAAEIHVGHRRIDHRRRFDFEHVARAEKFARVAQRLRAPAQRRHAWRVGRHEASAAVTHAPDAHGCSVPMRSPMRSVRPAVERAGPVRGARRQQQDHGRAHVEARHLGALGELRPARARSVTGSAVTSRCLRGVTSPCHTVAMLPTFSAPTRMMAHGMPPESNPQNTRSLRENSPGTSCAVVRLTLNSRPGT